MMESEQRSRQVMACEAFDRPPPPPAPAAARRRPRRRPPAPGAFGRKADGRIWGVRKWLPNLEPGKWNGLKPAVPWLTHFPSLRKVENWEAGLPLEAAQAWPVCLPGPGKFRLAPAQDALKPKPTSGCPISTRSSNTMEIPQRCWPGI